LPTDWIASLRLPATVRCAKPSPYAIDHTSAYKGQWDHCFHLRMFPAFQRVWLRRRRTQSACVDVRRRTSPRCAVRCVALRRRIPCEQDLKLGTWQTVTGCETVWRLVRYAQELRHEQLSLPRETVLDTQCGHIKGTNATHNLFTPETHSYKSKYLANLCIY